MVGDLKQLSAGGDYPPIVFLHQGTEEDGAAFFEHFWPEARAVADPERSLYKSFGLERGGLGELFGPSVVACGLRAAKKGHTLGKPVGDVFQMPGLFLVMRGDVVWHHDFAHAGDHPDFTKIPGLVARYRGSDNRWKQGD